MTDPDAIRIEDWEVPAHDTAVFAPKTHDIALVIPVIDEGDRIRRQLARLAEAAPPVDILVADGGSTDGSLDTDYLRRTGVRALLTKTGPGKLAAQQRMAYAWALREGYAGIVNVDGNDKDSMESISAFCAQLAEGYDYVQGSRYLRGGGHENTPLERVLANRLIHAPLLSLAGRRWLTDTTNGFRGYSARYLLDPRVRPFREAFAAYELLFYLTVRAGQLGYRVCEIPVRRAYPAGEAVPTKISGVSGKVDILRQTIAVAMRRFHP